MDMHTLFISDGNQQGPTIQHRELCSMLRGGLGGRRAWGEWMRVSWMAEALCCPLTLSQHAPIQNKSSKTKGKEHMGKRASVLVFSLLPYVFIYFLIYPSNTLPRKKRETTWRTEKEQRGQDWFCGFLFRAQPH